MRTFHDAVIVAVEAGVDHLVLRIEDVSADDGKGVEHESGKLTIQGVSTVEEDGALVTCGAVGAGFDDGQVLELSIAGGSLAMIVVWQNYAQRRDRIATYQVVGEKVSWEPDSPG